MILATALAAAVAFGVALTLSALLAKVTFAMDVPNHRSLHLVPTPRSGGIAIISGMLLGGALWLGIGDADGMAEPRLAWALAAAGVMGLAGMLDDLRPMSASAKIAFQLLAAGMAVWSGVVVEEVGLPGGGRLELGVWGAVLSVLWLLVCTNAVNFLDGADGLLAKTLLPGFFGIGGLGLVMGLPHVGGLALLAGAALWGFYVMNRPPARIFMGDSGSQFLGMLVGCLTIIAAPPVEARFSLLVIPLAFLPVLFDACFTVARRALALQPIWRAHRTHLFQLALRAGMTERAVGRVHLGLSLVSLGSAAAMMATPAPWHQAWVLPPILAHLWWFLHVVRLRAERGLPWNEAPMPVATS